MWAQDKQLKNLKFTLNNIIYFQPKKWHKFLSANYQSAPRFYKYLILHKLAKFAKFNSSKPSSLYFFLKAVFMALLIFVGQRKQGFSLPLFVKGQQKGKRLYKICSCCRRPLQKSIILFFLVSCFPRSLVFRFNFCFQKQIYLV